MALPGRKAVPLLCLIVCETRARCNKLYTEGTITV